MPLRVIVDGTPMAEADGRTFWQRFSAWMEEHRGDLAGFARTEGFASVHPEVHAGEPVLVASRSAPQKPYTTAATKRGGGAQGAKKPPRSRR